MRRARYAGTHVPGTSRYTFRTLAFDVALWACVLACGALALSLDWVAVDALLAH